MNSKMEASESVNDNISKCIVKNNLARTKTTECFNKIVETVASGHTSTVTEPVVVVPAPDRLDVSGMICRLLGIRRTSSIVTTA